MKKTFIFLAVAAWIIAIPLLAQNQKIQPWDVTLARGITRSIDFTTDEGTWMDMDVSPDGRWIVFDLLGLIYRVPVAGGDAQLLTRDAGISVNYEPRYSPDGSTIAFTSSRNGQDNIWLMNADGSNPRAAVVNPLSKLDQATWMPNGQYLLVRQRSRRKHGSICFECVGDGLYMYDKNGGTGIEITSNANPMEYHAEAPSVSADGRYLYFDVDARDTYSSSLDAVKGRKQVRRLDLSTGEVISIIAGVGLKNSGGGLSPAISPNGRWLAFAREIPTGTIEYHGHKFGPRTALWLRDLRTGTERIVMDPIQTDEADSAKSDRALPNYSWTADSNAIVITQGGKIRWLDIATGDVRNIPFRVRVQRTMTQQARGHFKISERDFRVRYLRWYTASPDAKQLAFQALGRIWIQDLPSGTPKPLTNDTEGPFQYSPAWSPDGHWIAFTTWDDMKGGQLWKIRPDGTGLKQLTNVAAEYLEPSWKPDGTELLVSKGSGFGLRGETSAAVAPWTVTRVPADGGEGIPVVNIELTGPVNPETTVPGARWGYLNRIYFVDRTPSTYANNEGYALYSVDSNGRDRQIHATSEWADVIELSPDGKEVAFQDGYNIYLSPFPYAHGAKPLVIGKLRGELPVKQLSTTGGMFPHWRDNGTLEFGSGPHYYSYRLADQTLKSVDIRLMASQPIPTGRIALMNARILTMSNPAVIEKGTIVIDGERIVCVGNCDVSKADTRFDLSGTTIIPGIIDCHMHNEKRNRIIQPEHDYEQASYLAYGVTTIFDPAAWSNSVFTTAELQRSGRMIGPRMFSTGEPLLWGNTVNHNEYTSYEVAEQEVDRIVDWGAVAIKQYDQARHDQRQWLADIGRKKGLNVTSEGMDLSTDVGEILNGQTRFEHAMGYVPLYSDVTTFLGQTHSVYSPTFAVLGHRPGCDSYFLNESVLWRNPKMQYWVPWKQLIASSRTSTNRPATDYACSIVAENMKDIIAQGGGAVIGSHGIVLGIGPDWEIWWTATGTGPMEALRITTIEGAKAIGIDKDVGSIEVGKIADLVILNSNPLDNIRNTADIRYVMQGGILREGLSLDEIWPKKKAYGERWWADPKMFLGDSKPDQP